jgi:hypothetical protein
MSAQEQVNRVLSDAGIAATFRHVPTEFDPRSKDWQHVAWRVTFKSGRGQFTTDYRQGLGHLPEAVYPKNGRLRIDQAEAVRRTLMTGKLCLLGKGYGFNPTTQPIPTPDAADVVYSLVSDASAADYATFEDWARDMGEDTDSRKAESTFNACRQIALDLFRVFGADTVEKLRPIVAEM